MHQQQPQRQEVFLRLLKRISYLLKINKSKKNKKYINGQKEDLDIRNFIKIVANLYFKNFIYCLNLLIQ
jgi:hypothetical protein